MSMTERLAHAVEVMAQRLKAGARIDRREFFKLCLTYSRFIDGTLAVNQTPASSKDLLALMKQILSQREDQDVRPAVVALLLSFKAAYRAGWFTVDESADVLTQANAMLESYHPVPPTAPSECSSVESLIGDLLSRFYPWLSLDKVLMCLETEAGYKALVSDFNIQPEQRMHVRLVTINKSRLDTPSCLSVPSTSFILNGYGVDRRAGDVGCQPPADCTKLVKRGLNILQIVGEFQAPYTVVVAATIKLVPKLVVSDLADAQPLSSHSDDDMIEGPSVVSLLCPISRKRIINPVKGADCNHLQCFDYNNYLEINNKRPSWRCPYCSRLVTWMDLRLEKKMAEILAKVDDTVKDVMLGSDGSWEVLAKSLREKSLPTVEVIELTETENNSTDFRQHESRIVFHDNDVEDRKPDVNSIQQSRLAQQSLEANFSRFSQQVPEGNFSRPTQQVPEVAVPGHRLQLLPRFQESDSGPILLPQAQSRNQEQYAQYDFRSSPRVQINR